MNDRAGLEIRYTLLGYRGFESLTFRKNKERGLSRWQASLLLFLLLLLDCGCNDLSHLGYTLLIRMDTIGLY